MVSSKTPVKVNPPHADRKWKKKNTSLPPLYKEPDYSYRQPRKGFVNHSLDDQDMNYPKPSTEMNTKIISHLRRHQNKRSQKTLYQTSQTKSISEQVDMLKSKQFTENEPAQEQTVNTIFTSYSETGEKFPNNNNSWKSYKKLPSCSHSILPQSSEINQERKNSKTILASISNDENVAKLLISQHTIQSEGSVQTNGSSTLTHFPPVSTRKSTDEGSSGKSHEEPIHIFSIPKWNAQKTMITEMSNKGWRFSNVELPMLPTTKTSHGSEQANSGAMDVMDALNSLGIASILNRPEIHEVMMTQILDGDVHNECHVAKNVHYLYIVSGNTDMDAELSFMQEHLYPHLRSHFVHQGQELRILDLHWGYKDTISDDHAIPDVLQRAIMKAHETNLGINFVILIGQKYGQCLLPAEIPKDEFEKILKVATKYRKREKMILRAAMHEIEELALKREDKDTANMLQSTAHVDQGKPQGNVAVDQGLTTAVPDSGTHNAQSSTRDTLISQENGRYQSVLSAKDLEEIKILREAEEQLPATKALRQWYLLDENTLPVVYKLQNISTIYKDILRNDATKRQLAKLAFASIENKLLKIFKMFTPEVVDDNKEALRRYTQSMLELELQHVLENSKDLEHSLCIVRTIDKLTNHIDEPIVGDYVDIVAGSQPWLDLDSWAKINNIRDSLVNLQVSENNVTSHLLEWGKGGIRPGTKRPHFMYAERLCKTLFDQIVSHLEVSSLEKSSISWRRDLFSEVAEHVQKCHERAFGCQGYTDILIQIKSYLKANIRQPLVVYGKSGCGKSSVLGLTATEIHNWLESDQVRPRVLVRMIGCTSDSTNVRTLLRDISRQLCHIFDNNPAEIPTDYKGIFNDLACRLGRATEENPLVLILDGVDRLSDDYEGRRLLWLPLELPPHVHIIISTNSDEKYTSLAAVRSLLTGHNSSFLEVGQLSEQEALTILRNELNNKKRSITDQQIVAFVEAFKRCPYPLFLKMTITDAIKWTSYQTIDVSKIGETMKNVVTSRFARLERDHGEPLIRRAVGYITASRQGLTSNEMEDIMSLDDTIMDDVVTTYKLSRRRIPTLLWIRLQEDMNDLITECWTDNMRTITWAHVQVRDVAEERYLNQRDKAPSYHRALAEYFSGVSSGNQTLQGNNDIASDRAITIQKIYSDPQNSHGDGSDRVYNLRALNELPFHFMKCQMTTQLKQSCLFNYEWMLARLCGTSLESLLEEYQLYLLAEPGDPEVRVLFDTLLLSSKALRHEPRQLASHIIGRLYRIVTADNPKAPGDPKMYPNLHPLLAAAKQSSVPALIPTTECLTEPGGIAFDLLSGHTDEITALSLTSDGMRALTASRDRTMKLWEIRSGKVIKSIDNVGSNVSNIKTAKSNSLAITVENSHIKIWDMHSSRCVFTIDKYVDPPNISIADNGQILVAVYDGSNVFRSWNIDNFSLLCETHISEISVHKDNSILITSAVSGQNVLHAFRSGNFATIRHSRSGKMIRNLQCHEKTSSLVALATTSEYFILCCRQQHVSLREIHNLELFDPVKGVYIRSVGGCPHDNIKHLTTNLAGSHAIAISSNIRKKTSDIVLFNLETEEHKHLASHSGVSTMCACLDFRYCVTGTIKDNFFKVWNLSAIINQPVPKVKMQLGLSDIWPMIDNPRYVLAKAVNNGPISVWNVTKGKCLQSAVRIERGLTEGFDALVMRNTRLVILTDRGLSNVSDDPVLVFQTVFVYDLKLKKYIRKLTGCYIVPAPSHEYTLLDNDSLLGPSDNRSHFIIWNLVTGHAVCRIKTGFKDLERKGLGRDAPLSEVLGNRIDTSSVMPRRERPAESKYSRRRRPDKRTEVDKQRLEGLRAERDNVIDQFLVSGDQKTLVASFYAHHMCIFDIPSYTHTYTLQTDCSMMFLHTSALTFDGRHLVHANFDEISKISYVTLWDCTTGNIKRRLKGEKDVCAIAITEDAKRIVIGRSPSAIHIWDPMRSNSLKRIRGYDGLRFEISSKIFLVENGDKAIVFAGDISVWDLTRRTLLAVFTPDACISVCTVVLNGKLILLGMYDKPELVVLKLTSSSIAQSEDTGGIELFGETTGDTSDEEDKDE